MALSKNKEEMIRLKKDEGLAVIPEGQYCYKIREVIRDEKQEHGLKIKTNLCPYWDYDDEKPDQMNGFCWFLNSGDWEEEGWGLLFDQCKSCGENENEWFGMKAKDDTPKVGVGVMIFKDKKLLLLKRQGSHGAGVWSLSSGGHMELGEDFIDVCVREVKEEVGIEIDYVNKLGFQNAIFESEGLHYVTLFFNAEWDEKQEAKIMEPDKASDMRWFEREELPDNLFGGLRAMIKELEEIVRG